MLLICSLKNSLLRFSFCLVFIAGLAISGAPVRVYYLSIIFAARRRWCKRLLAQESGSVIQNRFKMSTLIGEDQKDVLVSWSFLRFFLFNDSVDKSVIRTIKLIPLLYSWEKISNVSRWWWARLAINRGLNCTLQNKLRVYKQVISCVSDKSQENGNI